MDCKRSDDAIDNEDPGLNYYLINEPICAFTGSILQAILWLSIKGGLSDNAQWLYQCKYCIFTVDFT